MSTELVVQGFGKGLRPAGQRVQRHGVFSASIVHLFNPITRENGTAARRPGRGSAEKETKVMTA